MIPMSDFFIGRFREVALQMVKDKTFKTQIELVEDIDMNSSCRVRNALFYNAACLYFDEVKAFCDRHKVNWKYVKGESDVMFTKKN